MNDTADGADGKFQRSNAFYHNSDQCCTGAIDRKPRAGQETAVDKAVKLKIFQCDLDSSLKSRLK